MTTLPSVRLTVHPDLAALADAELTNALTECLEQLGDALAAPSPARPVVQVGERAEWGQIVLDGEPAPQPRVLLMRAAMVAGAVAGTPDAPVAAEIDSLPGFVAALAAGPGPDAVTRWATTLVHGTVLLALPRPLVATAASRPALRLAEQDLAGLVAAAESTGPSLARILDDAWAKRGLPVRAVQPLVDPELTPGCFRWEFGGVPMPLFGGLRVAPTRRQESDAPVSTAALGVAAELDLQWFGELLVDADAVERLLDDLAMAAPDLVAAARSLVGPAAVAGVLRQLTVEQIPLVNLSPVIERIVEAALAGCQPARLADRVRQGLPRHVALAAGAGDGVLSAWALEPGVAARFADPQAAPAGTAEAAAGLRQAVGRVLAAGAPRTVVVPDGARKAVAGALLPYAPDVVVVGAGEVPPRVQVRPVGVLPVEVA